MIRSVRYFTWKQDCSYYFQSEERRFVWSKLTFSERFIARSHSIAYLNSGWRTKWPQNATVQHWAGADWSSLKEKNDTFSLFIFSQNKFSYLQNCRHRYIYGTKWRHGAPCATLLTDVSLLAEPCRNFFTKDLNWNKTAEKQKINANRCWQYHSKLKL